MEEKSDINAERLSIAIIVPPVEKLRRIGVVSDSIKLAREKYTTRSNPTVLIPPNISLLSRNLPIINIIIAMINGIVTGYRYILVKNNNSNILIHYCY